MPIVPNFNHSDSYARTVGLTREDSVDTYFMVYNTCTINAIIKRIGHRVPVVSFLLVSFIK